VLRVAFEGSDIPARADFAFHRAVAQASGNALFADLLEMLHQPIEHAMTVALGITRAGSRDRASRVVEEHEAIAEAIERGTPRRLDWQCAIIYIAPVSGSRTANGTHETAKICHAGLVRRAHRRKLYDRLISWRWRSSQDRRLAKLHLHMTSPPAGTS